VNKPVICEVVSIAAVCGTWARASSVYELLSRQRLTEVFSATDKVDYCSACMAFNCSIHGL